MAGKLKTRINSSGYKQFFDQREGRWVFTHRRVAEKKTGREPRPGEEVHHINGDKQDNRPRNLVVLKDTLHDRIHHEAPDACFRCGRTSHWADECYATHDINGEEIDADEEDFDDEDEWEDDEDDDWEDDEDDY